MATLEITTVVGCPLMCTFCPQDALKKSYAGGSDKYLSLETFATVLDKVPEHVQLDFSGMSEPWANPDATRMVELALQRGRRVLGPGLQPQEIIVVGDTPFDVRCGKFIGAKTLAGATGGAKLDELKTCEPDWAVEDLTRVNWRAICGRQHGGA